MGSPIDFLYEMAAIVRICEIRFARIWRSDVSSITSGTG